MKLCPCSSGKNFADCCEPFIRGDSLPETPEKLMRSRYTAYSLANMDYIARTMQGVPLENFDKENAEKWAKSVEWQKLKVLNASVEPPHGFVEFMVYYSDNGKNQILHEKSEFLLVNDRWYYVDGETPKIGRNDLCPCGSQKKFKKCCGL